jgi:hypothetical protein
MFAKRHDLDRELKETIEMVFLVTLTPTLKVGENER